MYYITLLQISVCFVIARQCLASSALAKGECSSRCWNPVQHNSSVPGATIQQGVANKEECKELCVNNGACMGVDWNRTSSACWLQLKMLSLHNATNIDHWSLTNNCSDDCVSYCWLPVKSGFQGTGRDRQENITDESYCKFHCSSTPSCTGIDWDSDNKCYLISTEAPPMDQPGVDHWDIERMLPINCQNTVPPSTTDDYASSTVTTVTADVAPDTVVPLMNSAESLKEKCSETLRAGIWIAALVSTGLLYPMGFV